MWLINQAIAAGKKHDREHYHAIERPIAQLAQLYYNSKVEGHKHLPRDHFELYGEPKAVVSITPNAAAVYFMLGGAGMIPGWAQITEVGAQMNAVYKSGTVPEFPALIGDRAVLLCPTIHDSMISCEYAIVNKGEPMQEITVADSRSGQEYRIVLEQSVRSILTAEDARFKLVKPPEMPAIVMPTMPVVAN